MFENHPITIVIGIAVFLIGAITTIINDGSDLIHKAEESIGWRGYEEDIINSLNASFSIEKFQEILGQHLFYREGEHGYAEYVFERRDGKYWIQAITDQLGTVVIYSVTSCDTSFKPQISYSPRGIKIRLGESTFSEVEDTSKVSFDYVISNASKNSHLIEIEYIGDPTNYQTEFWGIIDTCDRTGFYENYVPNLPGELIMGDPVDKDDPILSQFREKYPINTYAVSSPLAEVGTILTDFQIGVDRIQVRVVYP